MSLLELNSRLLLRCPSSSVPKPSPAAAEAAVAAVVAVPPGAAAVAGYCLAVAPGFAARIFSAGMQ